MPERTLESLFPARVVAYGIAGWEAFLTGGAKDANLWRRDILDGQHSFDLLDNAKDAAKRIGAKLVKMSPRLYRLEYR